MPRFARVTKCGRGAACVTLGDRTKRRQRRLRADLAAVHQRLQLPPVRPAPERSLRLAVLEPHAPRSGPTARTAATASGRSSSTRSTWRSSSRDEPGLAPGATAVWCSGVSRAFAACLPQRRILARIATGLGGFAHTSTRRAPFREPFRSAIYEDILVLSVPHPVPWRPEEVMSIGRPHRHSARSANAAQWPAPGRKYASAAIAGHEIAGLAVAGPRHDRPGLPGALHAASQQDNAAAANPKASDQDVHYSRRSLSVITSGPQP